MHLKRPLEIFFHANLYSRDEMVLVPSDHLARTWDQNMGLADWSRIGIETTERPVDLLVADGARFQKSEVVVTIKLVRKPTHFLLSILFPMVLLVSLTWSVFWMHKESLSARVNIAFIGILSVVAIPVAATISTAGRFVRLCPGQWLRLRCVTDPDLGLPGTSFPAG